jgi:hypothetical protein
LDRESGFGLIVGSPAVLEAAWHPQRAKILAAGRVVGVKVRELLEDWPPRKWACDDSGSRALKSDPGKLRLLWFSVPDADSWFRLTATDSQGASWSTYCRAPKQITWHALEQALAASLKEPLDLAGDVELDSVTPPPIK